MSDQTAGNLPNTPILTVNDVAAFLQLPRSTAYKACNDGVIPCVKFGRHIRISRQKFLDWFSSTTA